MQKKLKNMQEIRCNKVWNMEYIDPFTGEPVNKALKPFRACLW